MAPFVKAADGDQEGLGLVVVEALGCGCPVVLSDLPACRDITDGTGAARLVQGASVAKLSDAIYDSLSNVNELSRQVIASAGELKKRFDWSSVAQRYAVRLGEACRSEESSAADSILSRLESPATPGRFSDDSGSHASRRRCRLAREYAVFHLVDGVEDIQSSVVVGDDDHAGPVVRERPRETVPSPADRDGCPGPRSVRRLGSRLAGWPGRGRPRRAAAGRPKSCVGDVVGPVADAEAVQQFQGASASLAADASPFSSQGDLDVLSAERNGIRFDFWNTKPMCLRRKARRSVNARGPSITSCRR